MSDTSDIGFSIRCPHCFEWSDWPDHPQNIAISPDEQQNILQGLKNNPESFEHKKMLMCKYDKCPAPVQCLIYPDSKSAHNFVKEIHTWTLPRAFRLHKKENRLECWPSYSGVLFCNRPVERQKNILLGELFDRELLSRVILGIALELGGTFTVYAANFLKPQDKEPLWVPVEPYTEDVQNVTQKYNLFCSICRKAMIRSTLAKLGNNLSNKNCDLYSAINNTCMGTKPPCQKGDWNYCPKYLKARQDLCYECDCNAIRDLENKWNRGTLESKYYEISTCWAGFKELVSPIIVHDHFVGMAMTGQFATDPADLPDVNSLVQKHPELKSSKKDLISVEQLFRGSREPENELETYTKRLLITTEELETKGERLSKNAKRIQEIANSRYRDIRFRREGVFKEELLGQIDIITPKPNLFQSSLLKILQRMCEFWAFQAVYFLNCPLKTGKLSLMAYCNKNETPNFFHIPKTLGDIEPTVFPTHPIPWLWDSDGQEGSEEPWLQALVKIFKQVIVNGGSIHIPIGRYYFVVLIPFLDQIYAFFFAVRDETATSPLRSFEKGKISSLCQQAILETCTETIERLLEFEHRQERERKAKLDVWRSLSDRTAHKINNWLFAARGALREQCKKDSSFEGIDDIQLAIDRIGQISHEFTRFSTDQPLNCKQLNVAKFINQEVKLHKQAVQGQVINVNVPDSLPECTWDPVQIGQVLAELLENAIHYTPRNGRIWVTVESAHKNGSEMVKIIVENEGQGVPKADKKQIFEPFIGTRADGTGLGLAIVEKIIKSHGGMIYENGQPGKNAKFVIELPINSQKEVSL